MSTSDFSLNRQNATLPDKLWSEVEVDSPLGTGGASFPPFTLELPDQSAVSQSLDDEPTTTDPDVTYVEANPIRQIVFPPLHWPSFAKEPIPYPPPVWQPQAIQGTYRIPHFDAPIILAISHQLFSLMASVAYGVDVGVGLAFEKLVHDMTAQNYPPRGGVVFVDGFAFDAVVAYLPLTRLRNHHPATVREDGTLNGRVIGDLFVSNGNPHWSERSISRPDTAWHIDGRSLVTLFYNSLVTDAGVDFEYAEHVLAQCGGFFYPKNGRFMDRIKDVNLYALSNALDLTSLHGDYCSSRGYYRDQRYLREPVRPSVPRNVRLDDRLHGFWARALPLADFDPAS